MTRSSNSRIAKRRRRAKYETLAAAVGRAIDEADSIGLLGMGCPAEEYLLEIGTIVPRVSQSLNLRLINGTARFRSLSRIPYCSQSARNSFRSHHRHNMSYSRTKQADTLRRFLLA
jgi:hypothetical protein